MTTKKPNFFIVGAPKCGTTAMSEYLRTHPQVHMSTPKEPRYFSTDITPSPYHSLDDYLLLFKTNNQNRVVLAEASTTYIYSKVALERIRSFSPSAKIMVMLRNPTDLVYAFHGELLKIGRETEWDFEIAWSLQEKRSRGESVPFSAKQRSAILQYRSIGCLGSQLNNVYELFPSTQVHVGIFDDFVTDPAAEYRRLLAFLGLPDDGRRDFPRVNESVQFKSRRIAGLSRRLRARALPISEIVKRRIGIPRLGIVSFIDRFNSKTHQRPPLSPKFRDHLSAAFRSEVELLETLLRRDLSAWKR